MAYQDARRKVLGPVVAELQLTAAQGQSCQCAGTRAARWEHATSLGLLSHIHHTTILDPYINICGHHAGLNCRDMFVLYTLLLGTTPNNGDSHINRWSDLPDDLYVF